MTRDHLLLKNLLAIACLCSVAAQQLAVTVDYVIVGGGPAGFVLAEQLSRNPDINVTLVEAGTDGGDASGINGNSQIRKQMSGNSQLMQTQYPAIL